MVVTIVKGVTAVSSDATLGTVMQISSGSGLTGGPITSSGTLSVNAGSGLTFSGAALIVTGFAVSSAAFNFNTTSNIFTHTGGNIIGVTTFTSAGNYTLLNSDYCLLVNKVTGAATTVLMLASPETGRMYKVKDGKLDAGTNNITISGNGKTIDGANTYAINTSGSAIELMYTGAQWSLM